MYLLAARAFSATARCWAQVCGLHIFWSRRSISAISARYLRNLGATLRHGPRVFWSQAYYRHGYCWSAHLSFADTTSALHWLLRIFRPPRVFGAALLVRPALKGLFSRVVARLLGRVIAQVHAAVLPRRTCGNGSACPYASRRASALARSGILAH